MIKLRFRADAGPAIRTLTGISRIVRVGSELRDTARKALDEEIQRRFVSDGDGEWAPPTPVTLYDRANRRRYYGRRAPAGLVSRQGTWSGGGLRAMLAQGPGGRDKDTSRGFRRLITNRAMRSFHFGRGPVNAPWPAISGPQPARSILKREARPRWLRESVFKYLERKLSEARRE